jgi:SAM-dependent methyltransferase
MVTGTTAKSSGGTPPSPWVERFAGLVRMGGTVADIACGAGRHVRLFRGRGHPVLAVDRDVSRLDDLADDPAVEILTADLEGVGWPLAGRRFAAVVVTNYLHRPLLPHLIAALAADGVLIYETFAVGNEQIGRPRNPDHLLRPGELLEMVAGRLVVVAYEHGRIDALRPAVRQRICAAAGELPRALFPDGGAKG